MAKITKKEIISIVEDLVYEGSNSGSSESFPAIGDAINKRNKVIERLVIKAIKDMPYGIILGFLENKGYEELERNIDKLKNFEDEIPYRTSYPPTRSSYLTELDEKKKEEMERILLLESSEVAVREIDELKATYTVKDREIASRICKELEEKFMVIDEEPIFTCFGVDKKNKIHTYTINEKVDEKIKVEIKKMTSRYGVEFHFMGNVELVTCGRAWA